MRSRPTSRRERYPRLAVILLASWMSLISTPCAMPLIAQESLDGSRIIYPEYTIKAAILLNFTKYVHWPDQAFADTQAPIVVGILGEDPFGEVIDQTFDERSSHGRRLELRRLENAKDAVGCCHLIFVSRAEKSRLPHLLAALDGEPVLIVGESDRFLRDGGGIKLVVNDENRVAFEINLDATDDVGLKLRSELLRLARRVMHEKRRERPRP